MYNIYVKILGLLISFNLVFGNVSLAYFSNDDWYFIEPDDEIEDIYKNGPSIPVRQGNVLNETGQKAPGSWYLGQTPKDYDPKKLPIVFVQGMHQQASNWWENTRFYGQNNMYKVAYEAGYRTVFLQTYDLEKIGVDQWKNGELLAKTLSEVSKYFGQKVNVVGFSKGGVDLQTSLVYYGAHEFVDKIITLGSPHRGSHIADLANSWYARWAFEFFDRADEGTFSMQTGKMAEFRTTTDKHPNINLNDYYTAGGTSIGPFPLSVGGIYLNQFGLNDGLVNLWSALLPYGKTLFTRDVDHDMISTGSSFDAIDKAFTKGIVEKSRPYPNNPQIQPESYLYGEKVNPGALYTHKFNVDKVKEVNFSVILNNSDSNIQMISPSGVIYKKGSPTYSFGRGKEILSDLFLHSFNIKSPEVGEWKLQISSQKEDGFLFTATFIGGKRIVQDNIPNYLDDSKYKIKVNSTSNISDVTVSTKIIDPLGNRQEYNIPIKSDYQESSIINTSFNKINFKQKGLYNITLDIVGKTRNKQTFNRTIVKSLYKAL